MTTDGVDDMVDRDCWNCDADAEVVAQDTRTDFRVPFCHRHAEELRDWKWEVTEIA